MTVKYNRQIWSNIQREVKQEVVRQTYAVDAEAKRLILEVPNPKTGRSYPRGGGKIHIASAPLEPFANDTGNAINLISVRFENNGFTGIVNAAAEYALELELGTEKMEPRPVFRPALANRESAIRTGIADAVKRGIAKSARPSTSNP